MKTSVSKFEFDDESKGEVRDFVLKRAKRSRRYLDFYGNGDMYRVMKRRTDTEIISIDSDPAIKPMLNHRDTLFTDLKSFCNTYNRKFDCIWLDYCGTFSQKIVDDLEELPKIMSRRGTLFITFFMGRERFMPKGTIRKAIDYGYLQVLKELFTDNKIKIEQFYKTKYLSDIDYEGRKKGQPSVMTVYGFEWSVKKNNK